VQELLEARLMQLAQRFAERVDDVPELREMEFSTVDDMADWLRVNEPALGLEFLADRLLEYGVLLSQADVVEIEACRLLCGLPESGRFSALHRLTSP